MSRVGIAVPLLIKSDMSSQARCEVKFSVKDETFNNAILKKIKKVDWVFRGEWVEKICFYSYRVELYEIRESEFVMVVKSGNAIMKLNTDTLKKFNRT